MALTKLGTIQLFLAEKGDHFDALVELTKF